MTEATKILVADDHPLVRAGVSVTLESRSEFLVVGEAKSGDTVLPSVQSLRPDILILDLEMSGESPSRIIAQCRQRHPEVKILILSSHTGPEHILPLRGLPIDGFLLENEAPDCLLQAMRVLESGGTWFSKAIKPLLAQAPVPGKESLLTQREHQVWELMRKGKDNRSIAQELSLSKTTIRRYATIIYEKLGVKTRVEAILA